MKEIKLGRGTDVALVDDEDYEYLSQWTWMKRVKGRSVYAVRQQYIEERKPNGKKKTVLINMHRVILEISDKKIFVDHKDSDGLNNQRSNLRESNHKTNNRNRRKHLNCSSKYKGVSWLPKFNKWKVDIYINGKNKGLGLFENEKEAARAYDKMAKLHFGEFAWLNFKE